jgi:phosphoribosylamine-glycine ligase
MRAVQKRAYDLVGTVSFNGMQYRHDIGDRAINRKG